MLNLLIKLRYFILFIIIITVSFFGYRAQTINIDFSMRSLFVSKDKAIDVLAEHRRTFGDDDNSVLIVLKSDKLFTPSFFYMLNSLTKDMENITIKRPSLKIDTNEKERKFKGLPSLKKSSKSKKSLKKDTNNKKDDLFNIEDEDEDEEDIVLSILDTPVGKEINPIDSVISLTNVKNIYGEKGEDDIDSMVIGYFLNKERLNSFKVDDFTELKDIRKSVMRNHMLKKQLISDDGKTTAIIIKLDDLFILENERTPILNKIDNIFKNYLKKHPKEIKELNLEYGVVGIPVSQREYSRFIATDMFFFFGLSSLIMGLVLLFIFRRFSGVFLPLSVVSLASITTFGIMELTNESINLVNNIIPTLILVIGLSDMIHIMHRYYTEINEHKLEKREAIIVTFKDLTLACFITSFTTAVGFFSLMSAKIDMIQRLGIYSGIGVVLAFVFIILLIPGVLYILPAPKMNMDRKQIISNELLEKIIDFNTKHIIHISLFFILLIIASGYFAFQMDINSKMLEEMKPNNIVRIDTKFAEKNLTGVMPIEISIKSKNRKGKFNVLKPNILKAMDDLKTYVRKHESSISSVMMISDYIKESYWASNGSNDKFYKIPQNSDNVDAESLILNYYDNLKNSENSENDIQRLVSNDGNTARVAFAQDDVGLNEFFRTIARLEKEIKLLFDDSVTVTVTGGNYVAFRAMRNIIHDMLSSLGWAFIIIAFIMMILLKSVKLGLLSMIPNVLPIVFTMGLMGITGITVRTSTVLIFSIALGIGVDDTIHFLSKYKKIAMDITLTNKEVIKNTMLTTGKAIIFTSFLIIIGVLVLAFSEFIAIEDYAILTSVTMFAALLANLFVLPILLQVFNPLNLKE